MVQPELMPGFGEGDDDAPVDVQPGCSHVARRLDLILVETLDGVVEREDHQQDVGVAETGIERDVVRYEVVGLIDDPGTT